LKAMRRRPEIGPVPIRVWHDFEQVVWRCSCRAASWFSPGPPLPEHGL
jgi:hypothetical protein